MSREILFRAKSIYQNVWIEGDLFHQFGKTHILNDKGRYQVDPSTVCQYTGLKDASGNKIWENDIIIVKEPFNSEVGIVRYGEYGHLYVGTDFHVGFYVNWQNNNAIWRNDLGFWAKDYSICGNVLDNPELLKGGTDEDD